MFDPGHKVSESREAKPEGLDAGLAVAFPSLGRVAFVTH